MKNSDGHYTSQDISDFRTLIFEYYGLRFVSVMIDHRGMYAVLPTSGIRDEPAQ